MRQDRSVIKRGNVSGKGILKLSELRKSPLLANALATFALTDDVVVQEYVAGVVAVASVEMTMPTSYNQNLWMHHLNGDAAYLPV